MAAKKVYLNEKYRPRHGLCVMVTDSEWEEIDAAAFSEGMSISAWGRKVLLKEAASQLASFDSREVLALSKA